MYSERTPPGHPGILPKWTSSAKIGVGTAVSGYSNVWFTISHGILNEVYYPRIDIANIRDLEFVVTDGHSFFSEEKRDCEHSYFLLQDGIPAHKIINTCKQGRYRIEKTIIADPRHHAVLQRIVFTPLIGTMADYKLYALTAPHIGNSGLHNTAWTGHYKGCPLLFAQREWISLACGCSTPFLAMTCGYVGVSDAWQDLSQNKRLTHCYEEAKDGNVALCGEIDLKGCSGAFTLSLAFGAHPEEAGLQARTSLSRDFAITLYEYTTGWLNVQSRFIDLSKADPEGGRLFRISTAVLKTHEGKHFSGSLIASLSIPWGSSKGESDFGGYHLIWPRDQVKAAQAMLASGDLQNARHTLLFLIATQESDGHWMQCLWADGKPYWDGQQMDETALPILLADHLRRTKNLAGIDPWPMVSSAAQYLVKHGPITQEDRWEENGGYTPFTLAAEISALLAAADFFDLHGKSEEAHYLRTTADWWFDSLDRWLYVKGTRLAVQSQTEGYYVRITPAAYDQPGERNQLLTIKNRTPGENQYPYYEIVSTDALALVRFGLRTADDPRIIDTVQVIDRFLKTHTAKGDLWHRYNEDGYGEHADGSPFDGTGIGRGWPLLTGERAHYELAAGNFTGATELLRSMAAFGGVGGLLPEQIWDAEDIPEKSLFNGHSTGSAKPLVWAHAEYLILLRSIQEGRVFDRPPQTTQRYLVEKVPCHIALWHAAAPFRLLPAGKILRVQTNATAMIRYTLNNWDSFIEILTRPTELGVHYADLPVDHLKKGAQVIFTMYYPETKCWEGKDFALDVE
jgi:glucoamylase